MGIFFVYIVKCLYIILFIHTLCGGIRKGFHTSLKVSAHYMIFVQFAYDFTDL